jgi:hypothetical protein
MRCGNERLVLLRGFVAEMMQLGKVVFDLLEGEQHGGPVVRAVLGELGARLLRHCFTAAAVVTTLTLHAALTLRQKICA